MDKQNRKFTCDMCGGTFDCGWSEEDALAELKEVFGKTSTDGCAQVCDECWEKVKPSNNPVIFSKYQKETTVEHRNNPA